ncbi:MAG TPA: nitroreductase/quinone reductase family protein [Acidimicrobiales bacterium]|nr:nitroreductase/quinone reductase family protein [Acidimicrobiales bacterium]
MTEPTVTEPTDTTPTTGTPARTPAERPTPESPRYLQPGWATQHLFNPLVQWLTRRGLSLKGSRELRVRGRSSGEWRRVPVNLLVLDDGQYLVAPRGQTQWVRNLRVARSGELRVGRRVDAFEATELEDDDKVDVLRAYLARWRSEVGIFFDGIGPDASDEQLRAVSPGYPVFRIEAAAR